LFRENKVLYRNAYLTWNAFDFDFDFFFLPFREENDAGSGRVWWCIRVQGFVKTGMFSKSATWMCLQRPLNPAAPPHPATILIKNRSSEQPLTIESRQNPINAVSIQML